MRQQFFNTNICKHQNNFILRRISLNLTSHARGSTNIGRLFCLKQIFFVTNEKWDFIVNMVTDNTEYMASNYGSLQ
jgi:hypothetical protein